MSANRAIRVLLAGTVILLLPGCALLGGAVGAARHTAGAALQTAGKAAQKVTNTADTVVTDPVRSAKKAKTTVKRNNARRKSTDTAPLGNRGQGFNR